MSTSCRATSLEELAKPASAALGLGLRDIVESDSGQSQNSDISSFGSYGAGRELETLPEGDQELGNEQEVIMSVPAAANLEDLTKFARLSKYFRGEHHLEEMMYHENCPRSVLLQLIDKFSGLLVKHEHEDPAVSMYFKGMQ